MSDFYDDGIVRLVHGDCLEVMAGMPDASVDAIVTDPPYNLSFMSKSWDAFKGREDAGFAYWLAGLIDGEGHFAIKQHTRGSHAPAFTLKMRADERGTLEAIHRHLRIGSIVDEKHEPNPLVKWVVQDKAGCQRLVDLLDKYPLRAKKRLDYDIWRESVCEWTDRPRGNRWQGAADDSRMANLRGRLMRVRNYVEPAWSGHEYQDWTRLWAAEALRIVKPGGYLLSFAGTRTVHRVASAIEDAGWEIRDTLVWAYASGFPKSLDVSKAIDKAAGAERDVVRTEDRRSDYDGRDRQSTAINTNWRAAEGRTDERDVSTRTVTAPATDAARQWEGWGTALKPAWEPIVMARKPLRGTVAANVLEYGTGALNIGGCRIPLQDGESYDINTFDNGAKPFGGAVGEPYTSRTVGNGRDGEASADRRYTEEGNTNFAALPGRRVKGRPLPIVSGSSAKMNGWENDANLCDLCALDVANPERSGAPATRASTTPKPAVLWPNGLETSTDISKAATGCSDGMTEESTATNSSIAESGRTPTGRSRKALLSTTSTTTRPTTDSPTCSSCDAEIISATTRANLSSTLNEEPDGTTPGSTALGRWPSNCILTDPIFDGDYPDEVVGGGSSTSGKSDGFTGPYTAEVYGEYAHNLINAEAVYGDSGGKSRFFVVPKADREERERGLADSPKGMVGGRNRPMVDSGTSPVAPSPTTSPPRANTHPTVKPLDLMKHLVRLVTPLGGLVVDPFVGSGTTMLACSEEGLRGIGIDQDKGYLTIAKARLIATPIGLGLSD